MKDVGPSVVVQHLLVNENTTYLGQCRLHRDNSVKQCVTPLVAMQRHFLLMAVQGPCSVILCNDSDFRVPEHQHQGLSEWVLNQEHWCLPMSHCSYALMYPLFPTVHSQKLHDHMCLAIFTTSTKNWFQ